MAVRIAAGGVVTRRVPGTVPEMAGENLVATVAEVTPCGASGATAGAYQAQSTTKEADTEEELLTEEPEAF